MLEILLGLFQSHRIDNLEVEMEALRLLVNPPAAQVEVVEAPEDQIDETLQCQQNMIAQLQTLLNKHIAQQKARQLCD